MKKIPIVILIFLFTTHFSIYNISNQNAESVLINHQLTYNKWYAFDSDTIIDSDYFALWSFYQSNPFVIIDVFALDHANFTNFSQDSGSVVKFQLSYDMLSDQGCFYPPYESVWHIVFQNVDYQFQRATILTMEVEFEQQHPEQNDAASGTDAGAQLEDAVLLEGTNYNSSGQLIYDDIIDIYKFRANQYDTIQLDIMGLTEFNCNFTLYTPSGLEIYEHKGRIATDLSYLLTLPSAGFWILIFEKANPNDLYKEIYNFHLIWRETPKTNNFAAAHTLPFILPFLILPSIIRKKNA